MTMPTPKKKPPQTKKTPPQKTKKPKQNLTSKPAKSAPKKSVSPFSYRKEGQPIPEPILRFFDVREMPSTLELANLAVSLAVAENGKPSPERALEFLEETAGTIRLIQNHVSEYAASQLPPMHLDFQSGIRYIIGAKGQARPKRELEQFKPILASYLLHEAMESAYEMEGKDEFFIPPRENDFAIDIMVESYIEEGKKKGFSGGELGSLRHWYLYDQRASHFIRND